MSTYHKTLIVVFAVVIVVVSGSLFFYLQSSINKKADQIQNQQPATIEGGSEPVVAMPPTATPIPAESVFQGSPVPTQPALPQTETQLRQESEYLESLLDEADEEDFSTTELDLNN